MTYQHIIFDLDGTLVDSAPSVLHSIASVLHQADLTAAVPLDSGLIGPPLKQILATASGLSDGGLLDRLAEDFKSVYDTEGILQTAVYPGIADMLQQLQQWPVDMSIATNKRDLPTRKIIEQLNWTFFQKIRALDSGPEVFAHKAALLESMLRDLQMEPRSVLYVGDKPEDGMAADSNGMPFCAVAWGYGDFVREALKTGWALVETPDEFLGWLRNEAERIEHG